MHKRVLGIDFGSRRIGVAISDPLRLIARSLTVVQNSPTAVDEIRRITEEYDVDTVAVGLPLNLKGESGMKAAEVEEFIVALRQAISCTIVTVDERFTSSIAAATLRTMGAKKSSRKVKGTIDAMAAALIAQSYLDRERAGGGR